MKIRNAANCAKPIQKIITTAYNRKTHNVIFSKLSNQLILINIIKIQVQKNLPK